MRQFIVYDQCSKGCPDSTQIKKIRSYSATQGHSRRRAVDSGVRFSTRRNTSHPTALKGTGIRSYHASQPDDEDEGTAVSSYPASPTTLPERNRHRAESAGEGPFNSLDSTYTTLPLRLQPFENKLLEYYVNVGASSSPYVGKLD